MTVEVAMSAGLRKVAVRKGATKCLTAFIKIPKGMAGNVLVQKTVVQIAAMKAMAALCVEVDAKKTMIKEGNVSAIQDALTRYVKARFPDEDKVSARTAALRTMTAEQEADLDVLILHTTKVYIFLMIDNLYFG